MISVVVPIYNVELYLRECLESLAAQTYTDLEVVMVDDGSTDGSADIAREFAAADPRFRLVQQPNGGLGNARNTGVRHAHGEYLTFLDSDDTVPPRAYAMMHSALEETGSDFATGNVYRIRDGRLVPSWWLAPVFAERRLKTHVREFPELVVDRIVTNKLWRRTFWDEHGFSFAEGVLHEDIYVSVPAQVLARSVDVIDKPVYHWRARVGVDLSITQQRTTLRALRDRVAATDYVRKFLRAHGAHDVAVRYDRSIVADDLPRYLDPLWRADDDYRAEFLDLVNTLLDDAEESVFDDLPAIERVKWQLVRRRRMPELLEVLRFQREDMEVTPPVRRRRRWYGDYPYLGDKKVGVPDHAYLLDREIQLVAGVDEVRWDDDDLVVTGYAYLTGIGAAQPKPRSKTDGVQVTLVSEDGQKRVPMQVESRRRADVAANSGEPVDVSAAGLVATLPASDLATGQTQRYTFEFDVGAGGVNRVGTAVQTSVLRPVHPAVRVPASGSALAAFVWNDGARVRVFSRYAVLTSVGFDGDHIDVRLDLSRSQGTGDFELEARHIRDDARYLLPVTVDGDVGTARVPVAALRDDVQDDEDEDDDRSTWRLSVMNDGRRIQLLVPGPEATGSWISGGREIRIGANRRGTTAVLVRPARVVVDEADWDDDVLTVQGTVSGSVVPELLVLSSREFSRHHLVATTVDGGRITARIPVAAMVDGGIGEAVPLAGGAWDLMAIRGDESWPVMVHPRLAPRLPLSTASGAKTFAVTTVTSRVVVTASRDLTDEERPLATRLQFHREVYGGRSRRRLRRVVLYSSFSSRQCSDSPLAVFEEVRRRRPRLDQAWVVRDGQAHPPAGAIAIRENSREHYELLASARWVVSNDHLSRWAARQRGQVWVQTGQGTPLRLASTETVSPRLALLPEPGYGTDLSAWSFVVSPNPHTTSVLRDIHGYTGQVLESGYPRNDALVGPGVQERAAAMRARLGLEPGRRTLLYAPTLRVAARHRRGRYRLDLHVELDRLAAALPPEWAVLVRRHPYVVDTLPAHLQRVVRDVTALDVSDALLAADVLVTDYSSVMCDYAVLERPILLVGDDLDSYEEQVGGLVVDLRHEAPGPLLASTDELVDAVKAIDAVGAEHAQRRQEWVNRFCPHDDGGAAARVVDRMFARGR